MSIKLVAYLFIMSLLDTNSRCIAAGSSEPEILLDQGTIQLEGWFSARGEWVLFANNDFKNYNPFNKDENKKCVSLVNGTPSPRAAYNVFDGSKVIVTGVAAKYDSLENGSSVSDRLLSKKYFKDELVENYCLREFVFVVTSIQAK